MQKPLLILSLLLIFFGCKKYEKWDVEDFQKAIVGKWEGSVTTPWVNPYEVEIEFFANGHYTSKAKSGAQPGLYYGTDDDSDLKVYSITSLDPNSTNAVGTITIAFAVGTTVVNEINDINFYIPLQRKKHLQFSFYHLSYGPVELDLKKM